MQSKYSKYLFVKLFLIALLLKIIFRLIYSESYIFSPNFKGFDYLELIEPIENLVNYKTFGINPNNPYAGRMPSMIFPYYVIRLLFDKNLSKNITCSLAVILSSIATSLLFMIILSTTQSRLLAFLGYFVNLVIPFYWWWDWVLHPHSFADSSTIFLIYSYMLYYKYAKKRYLFLMSFFSTWIFFLRPYLGMYILIFSLFIFMYDIKRNPLVKCVINQVIFLSFFIFFEGMWITRNYLTFKKFIPLQLERISIDDDVKFTYIRQLVSCWGGKTFWYYSDSDLDYFFNPKNNKSFPKYIFFDGFNSDSLLNLKKLTIAYEKQPNPLLKDKIKLKVKSFITEFRKKKWYVYYILAPIKRLGNFLLFEQPTQDWPPNIPFQQLNLFQKILKLLSFLEYYCNIIMFFIFFTLSALKLIKLNNNILFLIVALVLSILLEFSMIIMAHNYAYFQSTYLLIVIFNLYSISKLLNNKFNL